MKNSILGKARWLREVALATSKNNGARVAREWLKYATMFVMLLTLGSGNAWGAIASGTYVLCTSTNDLEAGAHYIIASGTSGTVYCISNESNSNNRKTASAIVSSSKITVASNSPIMTFTLGGSSDAWTFYTDNYAGTAGYLASAASGKNNYCLVISTLTTGTISFSNNAAVIDLKPHSSRTKLSYNSSVPCFACYSSGQAAVYLYKQETSCDNKVTISKGSETNGTFTLDKTGEQNACDALSVTVTPSPAEHFHVASVSATNPATTGTAGEAVDNGDGTWTITYSANSKGASTVNVTFEEDTKHTLTFYNNGAQVEQIQVYDGEKIGASLPSLTSNEACHATSQTFAGWTTENIGSTPVHTVDVDKIVDYWTKPTSDMTIYAIWATIPASATTTFAAAVYDAETAPITKEKDNITLYFDAGSIYKSKTPYTFTITSGNHYFSITASNKVLAKLETTCNDGTYCLYSVSDGTLSPNSSTASQTVTGINTYNVECYPKSDKQIRMQTCAVYCYDNYITSCQACVAPTSVTITGTNKYLGGQTISLTAAPDGGTGTPSYQWQKKISGVWTNLANDGSISGVTSNNLQISSCTHANSGGYRCIVSTGDGCETKSHADGTDGYGVHVFSIHGKYTTDADYSDTEIIWTSETTGTATISMDAKKTYLFKVWSNNGNYYGHGANTNEDFMFQPTTWDCGVNNNEMRLFTTVAGNYTFTVNIEHGLDGSPYVNVQVGYPSMTHPNSGYVYVQKFNWQPYLHYWYDNSHPLSTWGSDPQLAANQYTSICGTDYWCVPVIDYYCNFIAKDAAGNPSNTTRDQHTNSPHPGQRLYNDGSWKWGEFSTYTIAYAGGDGSTGGPMASHTGLCPGSSQKLTANAFSKAYHTFNGWSDGNGHTYADQAMIENIQSNINLTAQWTPEQYNITATLTNVTSTTSFPVVYTYTGSAAGVTYTFAAADGFRLPDAVTVTGSTYTWDQATGQLTLTGTISGAVSITISGVQTHTVTWMNNGSNYGDPVVYDHGAALVLPASDPSAPSSCSGKVFVGWTSDPEITSETSTEPTIISAGGAVETDATYRAVFATSSSNPLAGTVMWDEPFTGFSADDVPTAKSTGATVYNSTELTYACEDGGGTTKIYSANLAGGTSPELLVAKSGGSLTVSNIPTAGQTKLTLSYKSNAALDITSGTSGVMIGDASVEGNTYTRTITISQSPAVNNFSLAFTKSTTGNARLDDIHLVVPGSGTMTDYVTLCAPSWTITYDKNTSDPVTNLPSPTSVLQSTGSGTLSNTVPERATYTFSGWAETTSGAVAYVAGESITGVSADKTLYAVWTKTPVEELLLNYSELNKYVGDPAVTLEVTGVTPEGADPSVTWSSSNSSVASVVAATGVVTFGTVGTATITATSTVTGTTTAYCHVTVRNKPTATFMDLIHDGNGTDLSTYNMQNVAGTAIVFPTLDDYATPGDDCDTKHYVFVGWTTSDNNDDPQDHLVASGELEDGQDKVFYAVWADGVEGVSYTKLTTNSFKTSPTKYVIGAEYNGDTYYFYDCAATDANNGNGGCTTSPATNAPIQFTLSGTADALVATSTEAPARYLTPLTGNNFQMSATTKTIALSENGDILNASTTTWALRFNTSNKYLRWYNTAPGSAAYFYEVTAGAAVNYRTSCCTNNVPAPTVIATNTAYTVTLTWAAVDGATGYEVSWNGGAFEAATSPCVKSGLTASTDYIYKVRATYDPLVKCGALVASGNVTTDDVYSVTYSGGTGTGSCSPSGSVAPVSYEAGATVTLAPTNSFSLTSNRFAAWVVKDADDNVIPVSNNQFTMPAKNVTVTATWTAVQDKYYDRMHDGTDALHGGIADGEGKYYLVLEGCNYTVPALTDDAEGDTDCHTTHFKLLGWIAQSHLKADGQIKPDEESFIFQGGGTKSATGATYYAIWAIMTE